MLSSGLGWGGQVCSLWQYPGETLLSGATASVTSSVCGSARSELAVTAWAQGRHLHPWHCWIQCA